VRTIQRYSLHIKGDEERLVARIIELATRYGRYGYRRVTALLKQEGWKVNHKKVKENLEKRKAQRTTKATKTGQTLA